jgi:hypothetical protein
MCIFCILLIPISPYVININPSYRNLKEVRYINAFKGLPYYTMSVTRPEHIWSIGQPIQQIIIKDNQIEVPEHLPIVLMSRVPIDPHIIPNANLHLSYVDTYAYDQRDPEQKYLFYILDHQSLPSMMPKS